MITGFRKLIRISRHQKHIVDLCQATFGSLSGKEIIQHLIKRFYMQPIYEVDGKNEAQDLAFRAGQRSVVMYLLENIGLTEADVEIIEREAIKQ